MASIIAPNSAIFGASIQGSDPDHPLGIPTTSNVQINHANVKQSHNGSCSQSDVDFHDYLVAIRNSIEWKPVQIRCKDMRLYVFNDKPIGYHSLAHISTWICKASYCAPFDVEESAPLKIQAYTQTKLIIVRVCFTLIQLTSLSYRLKRVLGYIARLWEKRRLHRTHTRCHGAGYKCGSSGVFRGAPKDLQRMFTLPIARHCG